MRQKFIYLTLLLCSLLSYRIDAQTSTAQNGMLYRIEHQGNTAYLFGTIHVGLPSFYPLDARVVDALAKSNRLVVEIDIRDNAAFQQALNQYGLYPNGQSIESHLSPDSLAQLRRVLARFGIPLEQVRSMKPWLLANMLISLNLEQAGYARGDGIEFHLLEKAIAQTKPVLQLETPQSQLALFDGLNLQEQEQYLRENLIEIENGKALQKAQRLIQAWQSADVDAVNAFLVESLAEKTLNASFIQRSLLGKRNPEMAKKIESLLQNGQVSFIGVGLLHLIGEAGVPSLLEKHGYRVVKVY